MMRVGVLSEKIRASSAGLYIGFPGDGIARSFQAATVAMAKLGTFCKMIERRWPCLRPRAAAHTARRSLALSISLQDKKLPKYRIPPRPEATAAWNAVSMF